MTHRFASYLYALCLLSMQALPAAGVETGRVALAQADAAFLDRRFAACESLAATAWEACTRERDARGAGLAAAQIAAARALRGDLDGAAQWEEKARGMFRRAGDDRCLGNLAVAASLVAYLSSRQYGSAEPDEALRILDTAQSADPVRLAAVRTGILGGSNDGERVGQAYGSLNSELYSAAMAGDSARVGYAAMRLGWIEGETGGHRSARSQFERASRALASVDARSSRMASRNAGIAAWKTRDTGAARQILENVLAESDDDLRMQAIALNDLAMLTASLGQLDAGEAFERRAARAFDAFLAGIRSGKVTDNVLTDLQYVYKFRYVGRPAYLVSAFPGFLAHLAPELEAAP